MAYYTYDDLLEFDRVLQKEISQWSVQPPEGCGLVLCEDLFHWVVSIQGPETSPGPCPLYKGKQFWIRVKASSGYPLEPPEVVFVSNLEQGIGIPVHPHVYSNGSICLDILYSHGDGGWSPALTIEKIALSLQSMLASNAVLARPDGDAAYVQATRGKSPKQTHWDFDDYKV